MTDSQQPENYWSAPAASGADWAAPGADGSLSTPGEGQFPGGPPVGSPASAPMQPQAPQQPHPGVPTFRSWQPGILALRPMTFGDFLAVPFRAMRFNRAVVLGAPLLFSLATTLVVAATLWVVATDPQLGLLDSVPQLDGISPRSIAVLALMVVVTFLADVLSSSIIAPGVARAVLGERVSVATAWRQVWRKMGSLLMLYLVSAIVALVVFGAAAVPLILGAMNSDVATVIVGVAVVLLVATPFALAVGVLQGVARAMIVLEGIGFWAAIKRTLTLIKGRFWWSVLILLVTAVLINVVSSIVQYAGQFAGLILTAFAPESEAAVLIGFIAAYAIAYLLAIVMVYAYMGCVFALIYIDLRIRHEGFDVDLARAAEARAIEAKNRR